MKMTARLLLTLVLAALVGVLAVPPTLALAAGSPAPNNRCGCPQNVQKPSGAPGSFASDFFDFDTSATTAGPLGVDVIGGFLKDVWFKLPGPHCPGMVVTVVAEGAPGVAAPMFVVTHGGGLSFFVCDVTCDAIAGNGFFDSDVVIPFTGDTFLHSHTVPASQANRDFYYLVESGLSNELRVGLRMLCP